MSWKLTATKTGADSYTLLLEGKLKEGWQMYAESGESTGLEELKLQWEHTGVKAEETKWLSDVTGYTDPLFDNKVLKVYANPIILQQDIRIIGSIPEKFVVKITGFASRGNEFLPIQETIEVLLEGGIAESQKKRMNINLDQPVADCGEKVSTSDNSLWAVFGKGFLGGLIALLMPCIFPMLPVTVSFFMNRAASKRQGVRNGFLYGAFIFGIYVLASIPFHIAGTVNPQLFNIIATDKWVNIVFFAVFLLFALSLFGIFELKLPGANSTDKRSSSGSITGIFFMALTLAIVSFSCTGPILGFLLVNTISETNGAWALTTGMAGFGLALALPFGLFAMFPQWMKKLPKSGGWMVTLKKSLAFVELALALKFLSNADLVEHWGILKREVFIAIWLLITVALAAYLLNIQWLLRYGKFNVTRGRLLFGALSLTFAAYLVPGLTESKYANLKWVSGFPPPLSYSVYGKNNVHGKGVEPEVVNDYEKAVAIAKEKGKPLLVDFTGWACVNCRKMEENVWTRPEIKTLIDSHFVLVSLYVDDRKKLEDGSTMGERWASFQSNNFGSASQPQYVLLSPDEELLNHPVGYTATSEYQEWLECGMEAYKNSKKIVQR
ncbi:MAG: thioredoxin family protein [Sphingobacteriales bacterium]|nr:thioredoxin family protein [Sphingobacteriales bacterium]